MADVKKLKALVAVGKRDTEKADRQVGAVAEAKAKALTGATAEPTAGYAYDEFKREADGAPAILGSIGELRDEAVTYFDIDDEENANWLGKGK